MFLLNYKDIGKNIYTYRKAKRLTQKQLGEKIDRAESSIQKYEKGEIEIPNSVLQTIADALDVTYNQLVNWDLQETTNEIIAGINPALQQIIKSLGYRIAWKPTSKLLSIIDDNDNAIYITEQDLNDLEKETFSFIKYKIHELFANNSFLG